MNAIRSSSRALAASFFLVLFAVVANGPAYAFDWPFRSGLRGETAADSLPPEARETLARIRNGGPYPFHRDGATFQNRERRLPERPRGYYREFTVETPGSRDRGARRIVAGTGSTGNVQTSGEYYYTDDHYRSFRRIRE
ncbi:MAG: ribonuclease [Sterolibacteriaceae bacterium]|nr:ribonuclease [Candidatus Methylophosphatis haderslevensis]